MSRSTSKITSKKNVKILTSNHEGNENGFLVPIFNINDDFPSKAQHPEQVYLTVAKPGEVKGPHLHKIRWGLFTCIKGNVKIVCKTDIGYEEYYSGEKYDFQTIQVPAGIPNALINIGKNDCYVLNMPSPAWHLEMQDDYNVNFDDYDFSI